MKRMPRLTVAALLALGTPVLAQRVTLKAEQTPLTEVLKQLEAQTAALIMHPFHRAPERAPPIDLDVTDAPLRGVLKDLAEQANLELVRRAPYAYLLQRPVRPPSTGPTATAGPYTITVRAVQRFEDLTLTFPPDGPKTEARSVMKIRFDIDADDELDLVRLLSVERAGSAITDRGANLKAVREESSGLVSLRDPGASLGFPLPDAEARALLAVEGDLTAYREAHELLLEAALDGEAQPTPAGGFTLTVEPPQLREDGLRRIRYQVEGPFPERRDQEGMLPAILWLELADGVRVRPLGAGIPSPVRSATGETSVCKGSALFRPLGDVQPRKFHLRTMVTGGEVERLHFKLENVALPSPVE